MSEQDGNLEPASNLELEELEFEDDELPPSRDGGQRDPWHALDDFDDEE